MNSLLVVLVTLSFNGWAARADTFETSYLRFELPPYWQCRQEQTEWICQSRDPVLKRQASLVITAKEAGPEDTMARLRGVLSSPKITNRGTETPLSSVVEYTKDIRLGQTDWLEAKHNGSEIAGFTTFYWTTVTAPLHILVAFSFQNQSTATYSPVIERLKSSLTVIGNVSGGARPDESPAERATEVRPQASTPGPAELPANQGGPLGQWSKLLILMTIIGILGAGALLLVMRSKR